LGNLAARLEALRRFYEELAVGEGVTDIFWDVHE